ncbi:flavin reductase family protein [Peptostreptococcus faecalis]|uniref:flavin reductase family protein n=1 Tax=Peptostreptococcus faecalis TaxID=2045015 RepID=UPI000C7C1A9D|nr:flavin reductase family protein [Peptostreptococcus faecalis]
MKREINVFDYGGEIIKNVEKGVLLTTKADEKVNTMTISWGTLGIEWAKPIFTVFVREKRFTHEQLNKNGEFTINISLEESNNQVLSYCGTKSGKDIDKIKELGLILEEPECISVPGIRELPLTLECKVIYKQKKDSDEISEEDKLRFYPQDIESSDPGSNKDFHTAYYGEIVKAYIIE